MASDRSRPFDRPRFGYTGVVAQQGRVTLDRDVNAQMALAADRISFDALSFVGPCGTPDDGYRISTIRFAALGQDRTASSIRVAPLAQDRIAEFVDPIRRPIGRPILPQSPPDSPPDSPPQSPPIAVDYFNFRIAAGSMYLGGQLVRLPGPCAYADQPEWPAPTAYAGAQHELIWLDVTQTEVGAAEDADLLDVALGGPDTTARVKLLQRIRRQALDADTPTDCQAAWATLRNSWAAQGLEFDAATMALTPSARLQIAFSDAVGTTNPCDPVASGGYLGPENQLLRMAVTMVDGAPYLAWSYDNASALYQVKSCADGKTLVLANDPPDVFQYPAKGQWVEVLGAAAVHGTADGTVPGTLHYTAEATGTMHQLAQPYGQTASDDATNRMVLGDPDALLQGFTADPASPVFVRVWQNAQPIPSGGSADIALVDIAGVATGIIAQLRWPGAALAAGACWEVAVRPSTPQGVYPAEYLAAPQAAIGPRRWACPLALIDWTIPWAAQITDCRNSFETLVELTKRRSGCCSFTIDVAQVAGGAGLQAAIDRARDMARTLAGGDDASAFTVCLGPGSFALPTPLRFDASHSGLVLEAGAGRTVLCAAADADAADFADGLVVLTSAQGVTLRGLEVQPVEAPFPPLLLRQIRDVVSQAQLNADVLGSPRMAFGLRIADCAGLTLDSCTIAFSSDRPDAAADLVGAGIFLQGANGDLAVTRCRLISQLTPSFTPLRLAADATSPVFTNVMAGLDAAAQGDRAQFLGKLNLDATKFDASPATPMTEAAVSGAQVVKESSMQIASPQPDRVVAKEVTMPQPAAAATPAPAPAPAQVQVQVSQITPAQLIDQKSVAGWAAIIARRMGDATPTPVIAIAGLLAADGGSSALNAAQNPCTLGDADITGNVATALCFGALVIASFDSLRLQDNRCSDGVAGLWVSISGAVTPPPSQNYESFYPACQDFEEFQYLQALATVIAPPQDSSPPRFVPMIYIRTPPANPQNAVFVSGNDIRLLWQAANAQSDGGPVAQSAAGLMLALCRQNDWYAQDDSQIPPGATITGNRVWSGSGRAAPAALVTLSPSAPLAMAGNIFTNAVRDVPDFQPTALSVEVATNVDLGERGMAIVGNALLGASNLTQLPRPFPTPLNSWGSLNADPG